MDIIRGKDNVLFIRRAGADWQRVGYLTVNGMEATTQFLDVTTRETAGFNAAVPISISNTISFTALLATDESLGTKIGYKEILEIQNGLEQIEFRLEAFNQNFVRYGRAYIASLSESSPADSFITFSGALNVYGRMLELADLEPPSVPNLVISNIDAQTPSVLLEWSISTDNLAVAGYQLRKIGGGAAGIIEVGNVTTFLDRSIQYFTPYAYNVRAVDIAGNFSDWSARRLANVPLPSTIPDPPNYRIYQDGINKMYQNGTLKTYQ